jgi:hypothetical protein
MESTWSRIFLKGVKMRLQGGMKNVEEREDVGLGTTSYSLLL